MEFILATIYDTLCEIEDTDQVIEQVIEQVKKLLKVTIKEYSTKELMELLGLKYRPKI